VTADVPGSARTGTFDRAVSAVQAHNSCTVVPRSAIQWSQGRLRARPCRTGFSTAFSTQTAREAQSRAATSLAGRTAADPFCGGKVGPSRLGMQTRFRVRGCGGLAKPGASQVARAPGLMPTPLTPQRQPMAARRWHDEGNPRAIAAARPACNALLTRAWFQRTDDAVPAEGRPAS
jgi:hypothetical protein